VPSRKTVAIVCTLDTKHVHASLLKEAIEKRGHGVLIVDTGLRAGGALTADVPRERVATAAGIDPASLANTVDRGETLAAMARGATSILTDLQHKGEVHGVLGIGGGSGTAVASAVMRALPYGVPKLLVSTMAGRDVARYVGTKDIAMLPSITDIMGMNPLLERILRNAAGAMVGMLEVSDEQQRAYDGSTSPVVAITAFGTTTRAVLRCYEILEAASMKTMIFHANGTGGRAMEELVGLGEIDAVLDLTTTELADELCGGVLSAGPGRLEAAGARGIPQVVLPGAIDMVNFGPPPTLPAKYADRHFHRHNPATTVMRTTREENETLGRWVGEKLARATGPTVLLLPLRGFSEYDRDGGVFRDAEADQAFHDAAVRGINGVHPVLEIDANINDPVCAEKAAGLLIEMVRQRPSAREGSSDAGL
jgi:uncharacterized protein (UPF0261 family)